MNPSHAKQLARDAAWKLTPEYKQIQALRVAASVPQSTAAEFLGLSRVALSAAENGRRKWHDGEDDRLVELYTSIIARDYDKPFRWEDKPAISDISSRIEQCKLSSRDKLEINELIDEYKAGIAAEFEDKEEARLQTETETESKAGG